MDSELALSRDESLTNSENGHGERDVLGTFRTDDASGTQLLLLHGPVAVDRLLVAGTIWRESLFGQKEAEEGTL